MTAALSTAFLSLSSSSTIASSPAISCSIQSIRTNFICNPTPRLRVTYKAPLSGQCFRRIPPRIWCLHGGDSETNQEAEPSESPETDSSSVWLWILQPSGQCFRRILPRVWCLHGGDSEANQEAEPSESPETDSSSVSIDLKLPRRSLLLQFTCNVCGERTKRLISRLAYERGTVFVQCAGCLQHHKLVDNLGLVVEYDFRDEVL